MYIQRALGRCGRLKRYYRCTLPHDSTAGDLPGPPRSSFAQWLILGTHWKVYAGKPQETSNTNGYGFMGYAYFFFSTTTTDPKRIRYLDLWDMHIFLYNSYMDIRKSMAGVYKKLRCADALFRA